MGILDHLFDSDWQQREDIVSLQRKSEIHGAAQRRRYASQQKQNKKQVARIRELEDAVGTLALLSKALVGLLKEKGVWDDEAFQRICREIDLADGVEDGKTTLD